MTGGVCTLSLSARETALSSPREFVGRVYEQDRMVIWRYLRSVGIAPDEAQELTQEAFVRLYRAVCMGKRIQTPRAWLFTVASRLALDHHRAQSRHTGDSAEDGTRFLHTHAEHDGNPEHGVLQEERSNALQRAISQLSRQQQVCIHLRAEGMRYREIADVLGVSVSSVSEFLSRAIQRLRTLIDE